MDRSIQVLGPRSELDDLAAPSQNRSAYDVNASNPLEDLWCLLRRPRIFFTALKYGPREISAWAWGKAIFGALIAIWISEILTQRLLVPGDLYALLDGVDPRVLAYAEHRWHLSSVIPRVGALVAAALQFMILAAPFLKVTVLLSSTAALMVGLRAFGVAWERIRFERLLLRSLYVYWALFLTLIPGVGPLLAMLGWVLLSVNSVRWMFDLSVWRATVATAIVEFTVFTALTLMLFVPLSALILSFLA